MLRGIFICLLLIRTVIAFTQNFSVNIQRDFPLPLSHVFDPSKTTTDWISVVPVNDEMPYPDGLKSQLIKKTDEARSAFLNGKKRSNNFTQNKTNPLAIQTNFKSGIEVGSGSGTPNDNSVAVSNDGNVVAVLNTIVRFYKPDGTQLRTPLSLNNFALNPNKNLDTIPSMNRTYDPRVMYDPYQNRFIVVFMHGTTDKTSWIVVGFSTDSDPSKPWNVYKIPGAPIKDTVWSDYPIVSQTKEDIFFTVNLLKNGTSWEEGFTEAVIWQLNKKDGFDGKKLRNNFFNGIKYKNVPVWSICPVQNGPMPDGNDNYFLSVRPYSSKNDTIFLHHVTNSVSSGIAKFELIQLKNTQFYGFPPGALQPKKGWLLRTNDARVLTAVRIGNSIQFLQNSMNFATLQAHLLHTTIHDLYKSKNISSTLITNDSLDFGYPAICAVGKSELDPSVLVTCCFSGKNHFPGTGVFYKNRYGEYSKYQIIKRGSSLINYFYLDSNEQRWGDYEGIQMKYNEPGVFYAVGSYGKGNNMNAFVYRVELKDSVWKKYSADVNVYPIPTLGSLTVEVKLDMPGLYKIAMYDMIGQKVNIPIKLNMNAGVNLLELQTGGYRKGAYLLKIVDNNDQEIAQKTVVIQ